MKLSVQIQYFVVCCVETTPGKGTLQLCCIMILVC